LKDLRNELRGHAQAADDVGLSETGFAIYGVLLEPKPMKLAEPLGTPYAKVDEAKKELALLLEESTLEHR
jgi:type I restriction enzyme R subunit